MGKRISALLALVMTAFVVQVPTPAPADPSWTPPEGAVFNVPPPWGTTAERLAIINRVERAIEHAPSGSRILIATYLFDKKSSVDALINACKRGVSVRVILDGNIANTASQRLVKAFNSDNVDDNGPDTGNCGEGAPTPGETPDPLTGGEIVDSLDEVDAARPTWGGDLSYVTKCDKACRGTGASMHSKFYAFSQSGLASNVIMVSSSNLNRGGANKGWNDLSTFHGSSTHYQRYSQVHLEMTDEDRVGTGEGPGYNFDEGRYLSRFFPWTGAGKAGDPVLHDLRKVKCASAFGPTQIHVSQFWIKGERGNYIVDKLLGLAKSGCKVSIIYGAPSLQIASRLRAAAKQRLINVYDSRWWLDKVPGVDVRTHAKYILVKGSYGGDSSSYQVMTGTANWNPGSLARGDENSLNVSGAPTWNDYVANWNMIRKHSKRVPFNR